MKTDEELINIFEIKRSLRFINLKTRNRINKRLKAKGYNTRIRTANNQLIHPEYIQDWEKEYKTGIGNTDYKTFISSIYCVELR